VADLLHADRLRRCDAVDCAPPPPTRVEVAATEVPAIDYMAKDFDSLLRGMLDLLPARVPAWRDRTEADLGMAILELFAYAGDQLSQYQDRVANEAYLRTAVQYESVRRLLRLVDYAMDPGAAARALLSLEVSAATYLPAGFQVRTAPRLDDAEPVVFETARAAVLAPERNAVALAAAAPANAAGTELVLAAELDESLLPPGTMLLVHGPAGREWVRVARPPVVDTVAGTTTVTLAAPLARRHDDLARTVVRGNAVEATHGETRTQTQRGTGLPAQRVALDHAPLTYVADADGGPRTTLRVTVREDPTRPPVPWQEVEDFIASGADDRHYRVARANDGFATVVFGDGRQGRVPPALPGDPTLPAAQNVAVTYRTGVGESGNAGADTLTSFERAADPAIVRATNPTAAAGGREPQSIADAKLLGPRHLRAKNRAVTARDYEEVLRQGVRAEGATVVPLHVAARFRGGGGWTIVDVSVDLPGRAPLADAPALRDAIERRLGEVRLAGTDVHVGDARYAPVHVALTVHVLPSFFARHVREAVEAALRPGRLRDGTPTLFSPERLGFGDPLYLSDLYAAVMAVEGVESVSVTRFKRLGDRWPDREAAGVIVVHPLEIIRCDVDPGHPELGVLSVRTCGGKEQG
jgi:hypothetical protein